MFKSPNKQENEIVNIQKIHNIDNNLLIKLKQHFSDEEQQLYITNLYMYMNYHATNDYLINLEDVYKMIGFANKGNAMKTIKSNFVENEDYKIALFHMEKRKNEGGFNKETVMLNTDTFKNLCMIVKTDKGKEIRKYYVKLENIYNEIIKEQIEESQSALEEQKLLLINKDKELEENKEQFENLKKLKTKRWFNQESGDTVYAIKVDNIIKIGKTRNIKKRESYYTDNQIGDIFYIKRCYNCDLIEKVIHHILDKHREENNKEWFNISDELAIYTIDIVCDFLDKFIGCSENLPLSNIKEYINTSYECINEEDLDTFQEDKHENKDNKLNLNNSSMLNKVVKIECNDDKIKKFISEFCELGDENSVLSYELFGAYRIWAKGCTNTDRTQFSKFMKKNYESKRKYYKEFNSSLLTYFGIKPKDLKIVREDVNILPKYEEFVLTECKYNYNYRIAYSTFIDEYKIWYSKKYPEYTISKQEQFNMDTYINRHFLKEKINMPGYRNVIGIWGVQLNSDNNIKVGMIPDKRKSVVKIDYNTKKVVEEYESLDIASRILKLHTTTIRKIIRNKKVYENYILEYKQNVIIKYF